MESHASFSLSSGACYWWGGADNVGERQIKMELESEREREREEKERERESGGE